MRLVWTEPALRDLAAARAYIARDSVAAADRQVDRVITAVASLLQFPEIGRPGRRARTRERVVSRTPYIVPYRLRGVLMALHHTRRVR